MCMQTKALGLLTLAPTSVLLSFSFFILVVARKVDSQALKIFGYVIAVLFWIAAALIFSTGISFLGTGQQMRCPMLQNKTYRQMPAMMTQGQMQEKMQQPSISNK